MLSNASSIDFLLAISKTTTGTEIQIGIYFRFSKLFSLTRACVRTGAYAHVDYIFRARVLVCFKHTRINNKKNIYIYLINLFLLLSILELIHTVEEYQNKPC